MAKLQTVPSPCIYNTLFKRLVSASYSLIKYCEVAHGVVPRLLSSDYSYAAANRTIDPACHFIARHTKQPSVQQISSRPLSRNVFVVFRSLRSFSAFVVSQFIKRKVRRMCSRGQEKEESNNYFRVMRTQGPLVLSEL